MCDGVEPVLRSDMEMLPLGGSIWSLSAALCRASASDLFKMACEAVHCKGLSK